MKLISFMTLLLTSCRDAPKSPSLPHQPPKVVDQNDPKGKQETAPFRINLQNVSRKGSSNILIQIDLIPREPGLSLHDCFLSAEVNLPYSSEKELLQGKYQGKNPSYSCPLNDTCITGLDMSDELIATFQEGKLIRLKIQYTPKKKKDTTDEPPEFCITVTQKNKEGKVLHKEVSKMKI